MVLLCFLQCRFESKLLYPLTTKLSAAMEKTYVVFNGRKLGVYERWEEAQGQVNGFRGVCYKGYSNKEKALRAFDEYMKKPFVATGSSSTSAPISSATFAPTSSSTSAPSSSSTSAPSSSLKKKKQNEKIAQLVDAQVELAREHQRNALRMDELSEELEVLLESLQFRDDD
ncbi:uncharacterized protein [Primulina eburnea]|uniref:uncharacterized protein n=1 Tax=Primulina eburnea TaxID=1245227 RepID=UPI003C6BF686